MSSTPKVSVVITSYNHAAYVRQSIQSILDQSLQDFEIIVVDDASTDDSMSILRGFADQRLSLEPSLRNWGVSATTNRGIRKARGRYVALQASDDWAFADRLRCQAEFLDNNPEISMVLSIPQLVDEGGEPLPDMPTSTKPLRLPDFSRARLLAELFFEGNFLWPSGAMARRELFTGSFVFDTRLTNLQDFDLFVRMLLAGHSLHVLPEKLTAYRIRDNAQNLSAPRKDSALRSSFEFAMILRHYRTLTSPFFDEVFGAAIAERALPHRRSPLLHLSILR